MKLILPLPPSKNEIKACVRGRLIHTSKYRYYKKYVAGILVEQLINECKLTGARYIMGRPLYTLSYENQLIMKIIVYLADKRRDAHNILEPLLDCLTGYVYNDDKYCVPQIQLCRIDAQSPRVEIEI